jgi:uncharacterized protein YeaO (DUF488 family)
LPATSADQLHGGGGIRRRYQAELAEPERRAGLRHPRELARSGPLTLLTATRDLDRSQAAVLADHLHNAGVGGASRVEDHP